MFNTINKNKIELVDEIIKAKYKADYDLILYYHFLSDIKDFEIKNNIKRDTIKKLF